ncbi:hypothetical protein KKB40_06325 [Patescibacteria group bacterium]|nr:hypothetical protein [Patescibacteria group bacterium]
MRIDKKENSKDSGNGKAVGVQSDSAGAAMSALVSGVTPEQTLQKVNDDHTTALAESYLTPALHRKLTDL